MPWTTLTTVEWDDIQSIMNVILPVDIWASVVTEIPTNSYYKEAAAIGGKTLFGNEENFDLWISNDEDFRRAEQPAIDQQVRSFLQAYPIGDLSSFSLLDLSGIVADINGAIEGLFVAIPGIDGLAGDVVDAAA